MLGVNPTAQHGQVVQYYNILSLSLSLYVPVSNSFVVQEWRSLYKEPHDENIFEHSSSQPSFWSGIELTGIVFAHKSNASKGSELEE